MKSWTPIAFAAAITSSILIESSNKKVAQSENTVLVEKDKVTVTTE